MKLLLQRVKEASVIVQPATVGSIGQGYLLFVGITHTDTQADAKNLVEKVLKLRLFADDEGKSGFGKSIVDVGGSVLVVSQFTLYADCKKGTRPSFTEAARPEVAEPLYAYVVNLFHQAGICVKTGVFGAHMEVSLVNDGPVTLLLES